MNFTIRSESRDPGGQDWRNNRALVEYDSGIFDALLYDPNQLSTII